MEKDDREFLSHNHSSLGDLWDFLERYNHGDTLAQFVMSKAKEMWFYEVKDDIFVMYRFFEKWADEIWYEEYDIFGSHLDDLFEDLRNDGYRFLNDDDIKSLPAIFRSGYVWHRGPQYKSNEEGRCMTSLWTSMTYVKVY